LEQPRAAGSDDKRDRERQTGDRSVEQRTHASHFASGGAAEGGDFVTAELLENALFRVVFTQ
jgi:hypothetical protein